MTLNTDELIDDKILRDVAVRLTVIAKDEHPLTHGSAVVYRPVGRSDYIYVITARHCLDEFLEDENNEDKKKEACKIKLDFIVDGEIYPQHVIDFKKEKEDGKIFLSQKQDFALMIIPCSSLGDDLKKIDFPDLRIAKADDMEKLGVKLWFRGFPHSKLENPETINCVLMQTSGEFKFKAKEDLHNLEKSAHVIMKAFSGSGILLANNNHPLLAGLVLEVENDLERIVSLDFGAVEKEINKQLEDRKLPPLIFYNGSFLPLLPGDYPDDENPIGFPAC